MRRAKPQPIRNKLDLSDRTQVRLVRKRLRLSDTQLTEIADRIGNSISAIAKEVAAQRARRLPEPVSADIPAAVMTAIAATEQADTEFTVTEQAP
jgi:hypothetical protein